MEISQLHGVSRWNWERGTGGIRIDVIDARTHLSVANEDGNLHNESHCSNNGELDLLAMKESTVDYWSDYLARTRLSRLIMNRGAREERCTQSAFAAGCARAAIMKYLERAFSQLTLPPQMRNHHHHHRHLSLLRRRRLRTIILMQPPLQPRKLAIVAVRGCSGEIQGWSSHGNCAGQWSLKSCRDIPVPLIFFFFLGARELTLLLL